MVAGLALSLAVLAGGRAAGQETVVIGGSGLPAVEVNLDAALAAPVASAALAPPVARSPLKSPRCERPPLVDIRALDPSLLASATRARAPAASPTQTRKPARAAAAAPEARAAEVAAPPPASKPAEASPAAAAVALPALPSVETAPSAPPETPPLARAAAAVPQADADTVSVPPARPSALDQVAARLVFPAGSAELGGGLTRRLDAVADGMSSGDGRLLLQAYAAADPSGASGARRLSLARALEVRSYLMRKGLKSTRIDVRALGGAAGAGPADRVDVIVLGR